MAEIIQINSPRQFSEEEAGTLLPTIKRITTQAATDATKIEEQLRFIPRDEPIFRRFASELDIVIRRWAVKIKKLGLRPSGLWIVDFDAGNGWFSWRLGDDHVTYFDATEPRKETGLAEKEFLE